MFRFEEINMLFLLVGILLLLGLFLLFMRMKANAISRFADKHLFDKLSQSNNKKSELKQFVLFASGLALLIIALSNPQWGTKMERVKAKSSDIIIAMDISQSMLADDILPNRMERAKRFGERLIRSLRGERIGLISFAGSAYLQMPLTADYAAAEIFAKSANPNQAGTQGTAIADAIDLAANLFEEEAPYQKALIIITDGENHDSDALSSAKKATENGIVIYTIGVGTPQGGYVPIDLNGKRQYLTDKQGNIVTSIMNKNMIEELAEAGNGRSYFLSQSNDIIADIKSAISRMEKREVQQQSFTEYVSYFQYFLFLGIVLLVYRFAVQHAFIKRN